MPAASPRPETSPTTTSSRRFGQGDDVVPVAPDLDSLLARLVAGARLRALERRQLVREQRVLQRLGDRPLLGVQALVLGERVLELAGEVLGGSAPTGEPGDEPADAKGQDHTADRDDPRQPLRQRAGERLARSDDERQHVVAERHREALGRAAERRMADARDEQVVRVHCPTEVKRVIELRERLILAEP